MLEFLVVTAQKDVPALLEYLRKILGDISSVKIDGIKEPVTVSIGVYTSFNSKKKSTQYFIEKADEQLYNAKTNEKNCVSYKNELYR